MSPCKCFFAAFNLEGIPIVVEEAVVAGDWAFTRVAFRISVTPKGEPEASPRSGKALSILKRQADGSWKISHDCYNSNVPPPVE
jgi:ketosteroid isomerase-like protein